MLSANSIYRDVVFYDTEKYTLDSVSARLIVNGTDVGPATASDATPGRVDVTASLSGVGVGDEVWVELDPAFNGRAYPKWRTTSKFVSRDSTGKLRVANELGNHLPGVGETYDVTDGEITLALEVIDQ